MQSSDSLAQAPLWAPPKAPLPPQRLAKLANALGIPIPAMPSRSLSEPAFPPARSPTPSGSAHPSTSKYLLHVIPPQYLLDLVLPPPSANGYHTQFRRGVLVPVCANFQSQLTAIAKEYALPSTAGMILYLVNSSSDDPDMTDTSNEPGARLTEEIWTHIWTRVFKAEQMDDDILPQPSNLYRLRSQHEAGSTPFLSQTEADPTSQLKPLISATGTPQNKSLASPFTPSSSASSMSDLHLNSKSPSPSEPDTPNTSQASVHEAALRAKRLLLPGLGSPSLIPVLAKVEFDIDRRKATWYEPWLRSRRANHAKRARCKQPSVAEGETRGNQPPLALLTGTKDAVIPPDAGYTLLSDEAESGSESEGENATARVRSHTAAKDPLEDVFGSDADTWQEIRNTEKRFVNGSSNPNIIPLALTGAELSVLPNLDNFEKGGYQNEEEEVKELLDKMSRPRLSVTTSSSRDLSGETSASELDNYPRVRSPEESEKRVGTIFDDLDLGLDPTEDFDDNDPYDKRRSQFIMKAKLDEIERAMLELSPRALKTSLEDDSTSQRSKAGYLTASPTRSGVVRAGQLRHSDTDLTPAWPAIPVSSVPINANAPQRVAVIDITTPDPVPALLPATESTAEPSPAVQEDRHAPDIFVQTEESGSMDSPVPLSPDPFGRYSSTVLPPVESFPREIVTSRFSLDSTDEVHSKSTNRTTLMSMKGIKKFWRRSDKSSQSNNSTVGRMSPNQPPPRPSKEDLPPVPDRPAMASVPSGRASVDQLSVLPTIRSPSPNSAASPHFDKLCFDQDSPYPTHLPSVRQMRAASPPLPPLPEPEKAIRKSILKWATKSRNGSISQATTESKGSSDQSRPPSRAGGIAESLRSKQRSVVGLVLGHVQTLSTDLPPSPQIPDQFIVNSRPAVPVAPNVKRQSASNTKPPRSSIDSQQLLDCQPRSSTTTRSSSPSVTSSRDSRSTGPSFDASQFEIVSPKASSLTYPYHGLDHD